MKTNSHPDQNIFERIKITDVNKDHLNLIYFNLVDRSSYKSKLPDYNL